MKQTMGLCSVKGVEFIVRVELEATWGQKRAKHDTWKRPGRLRDGRRKSVCLLASMMEANVITTVVDVLFIRTLTLTQP